MKLVCILLFMAIVVLSVKLRKARGYIEEAKYEAKRIAEWGAKYEKMYTDLQEKRIYIKDPFFNERVSEYERVEYVPAEKIELDCDMERIEREVKLNYDFYKKALDMSQFLREKHEKEGIPYEELARTYTSNEAYVCYEQSYAIRGYKEGNTYNLVNGNHRVFLAKKLGMDVPYVVLGKGKFIAVKELVRSGVLDWKSIVETTTEETANKL